MPLLCAIQETVVAAAAVAALLFPVPLAAADTARAELGVGATVVATCVVSTGAQAGTLSCTHGTQPSITTERNGVSLDAPRSQGTKVEANRETAAATASAAVTFVTISY